MRNGRGFISSKLRFSPGSVMAPELGSHPKLTPIADALVYVALRADKTVWLSTGWLYSVEFGVNN